MRKLVIYSIVAILITYRLWWLGGSVAIKHLSTLNIVRCSVKSLGGRHFFSENDFPYWLYHSFPTALMWVHIIVSAIIGLIVGTISETV